MKLKVKKGLMQGATGYNEDIKIGLDSAASSFYANDGYFIDGNRLSPDEIIAYYADLVSTYPNHSA